MPTRRFIVSLTHFLVLGLMLLALVPITLKGQDSNQVALVVRHGDQSVQSICVDIEEEEVTGLELLQESGLALALDVQGLGAAVCRIGNTGCPADDCWCQCKGGGSCIYWSFWHQPGGEWQYSQAGASQLKVRDGDIQGWSWGPGAVTEAIAPPQTSFGDVCQADNEEEMPPTVTPTSTHTATAIVFAPEETSTPLSGQAQPVYTATLPATVTKQGQPTVTAVPTETATYTVTPPPSPTAVTLTRENTAAAATVLSPTPALEAVEEMASPQAVGGSLSRERATVVPTPTEIVAVAGPEPSPSVQNVAAAVIEESRAASSPAVQGARQPLPKRAGSQQPVAVVGSAADLPALNGPRLQTTEAPQPQVEPVSLVPYLYFAMIMTGLLGLWLVTWTRGRGWGRKE